MGWFKNMIRNWLRIVPAPGQSISIRESSTFEADAVRNQIWYRGDASELEQLYTQLGPDGPGSSRFWAAAPPSGIRKMHSGLPAMLVDTLSYVVKSDLLDPDFVDDHAAQSRWDEITADLDFAALVGKAVTDVLINGDGAFKIAVDTDLSKYPLVEFVPGSQVEYSFQRGVITDICFKTVYHSGNKEYMLREIYQKNRVSYALYDGDKQVPMDRVPELSGLKPAAFTGDYIMAVPFKVYESAKYPGRGKSIFDTKTDVFDAHDETISQWMDALRAGRVTKYIPIDMIPRNPENGELYDVSAVNNFGTNFTAVESLMNETGKQGKIETVQPDIRYEAFLSTYTATLDMCLQGVISPATLGIDIGKMSSGEAQRERKDVTGNTRNAITAALEKVLPVLISAMLKTYDNVSGSEIGHYEPKVTFGEYGAPDFDARIKSLQAAAAGGLMSTESIVDELWGSSKDEEWKAKEVERLRQEKGLEEATPPRVGDELNDLA